MTANERDEALKAFLNEYGSRPQIDMTVEEMSELTKALMKWKRALTLDEACARKANIVEELADVRIMERQMEILFHCEDEVERWIDLKIQRQIGRLNDRKEQ